MATRAATGSLAIEHRLVVNSLSCTFCISLLTASSRFLNIVRIQSQKSVGSGNLLYHTCTLGQCVYSGKEKKMKCK